MPSEHQYTPIAYLGVGEFISLSNRDVNANDLKLGSGKVGVRHYCIVPSSGYTISGLPDGFDSVVSLLTVISYDGYDQIQYVWKRNTLELYFRTLAGNTWKNWTGLA